MSGSSVAPLNITASLASLFDRQLVVKGDIFKDRSNFLLHKLPSLSCCGVYH
ncbi:MAG TPA: hypothetical protein VLA84_10055 [Microcoleus sp.]|nr:hypothetical protein [Microcoleus sp.]